MAKRGGSKHTRRITLTRSVPVFGRKRITWTMTASPGPHAKKTSVPLGVLLRDELHMAVNTREAKKILNTNQVMVDGKPVKNERRPIGLMDIVEIPKAGKIWRMQILHGRLAAKEVSAAVAKVKLCKVINKSTVKGGKISITMHDGRNLLADNNVKMGATIRMSVPEFKMMGMLPLSPGVRCLVISGKHAGEIAVLEKIIERIGSMDPEAQLKSGNESFVTVMKYLFAVDNEFA